MAIRHLGPAMALAPGFRLKSHAGGLRRSLCVPVGDVYAKPVPKVIATLHPGGDQETHWRRHKGCGRRGKVAVWEAKAPFGLDSQTCRARRIFGRKRRQRRPGLGDTGRPINAACRIRWTLAQSVTLKSPAGATEDPRWPPAYQGLGGIGGENARDCHAHIARELVEPHGGV